MFALVVLNTLCQWFQVKIPPKIAVGKNVSQKKGQNAPNVPPKCLSLFSVSQENPKDPTVLSRALNLSGSILSALSPSCSSHYSYFPKNNYVAKSVKWGGNKFGKVYYGAQSESGHFPTPCWAKNSKKEERNGPKMTIFVFYLNTFVFSDPGLGWFCFVVIFRISGIRRFLCSVPAPQNRNSDPYTSAKVLRYKWEAYRDTNWWCVCNASSQPSCDNFQKHCGQESVWLSSSTRWPKMNLNDCTKNVFGIVFAIISGWSATLSRTPCKIPKAVAPSHFLEDEGAIYLNLSIWDHSSPVIE